MFAPLVALIPNRAPVYAQEATDSSTITATPPAEQDLASPDTPTPTDPPKETDPPEIGQILDGISTTAEAASTPLWQSLDSTTDQTTVPVQLGREYRYRNTSVSVVFTKLPDSPGTLTISEVKLTPEQMEELGAFSDTAYDITSSMVDGTFTYNLTLPLPEGAKDRPIEVVSGETVDEVTTNAEVVDEPKEIKSETITISGLDHFTVFVLVNNVVGDDGDSSTSDDIANGVITTLDDTWVDQASPTNNEGTDNELKVRSKSGSDNRRAFVKFDLSDIDSDAEVTKATLRLFLDDAPGVSRTYEAYRITGNWTEDSLDWDPQPGDAGVTDAVASGTSNNVWLEWDVTGDVQGSLDGDFTNYGWMIRDSSEDSGTGREGIFHSSESTGNTELQRPQLVVDFAALDDQPTDYKSPTAEEADEDEGDEDGLDTSPGNAFADGGGVATNVGGVGDRHLFYNYDFDIPEGSTINGIEVRADWYLDSTSGVNSLDVELSRNGGGDWTDAKTDATETDEEHVASLGGATDTWGWDWSADEFSNDNFRVRVTMNLSSSNRDFYLDWIPVRVYYSPASDTTAPVLAEVTPVSTPTNNSTPDYTFNSNEDGDISYGGSCSSSTSSAVAGDNTITFSSLPDGTYSDCTITVTDSAGNPSDPLSVSTFIIDTQDPVSLFSSPADGSFWNSSISIEGSSTDVPDTTVDYVTLYYWDDDEGEWIEITQLFNDGLNEPFNWNYDWEPENDGVYDIMAEATDTAGNTESSPVVEEVTYDRTAPTDPGTPTADIPSPTNQSPITWTWDAAVDLVSGVSVYLWNLWWNGSLTDSDSTSDTQLEYDVYDEYGEGDFYIDIQAQDYAGNTSNVVTSETTTIDVIAPTVTAAETQDTNGNGQIDTIKLTFSEDIDDSRLDIGNPDGWDVDGYDGEAIGTGEGDENDNILVLTFGEGPTPDTANTPTVTYTPTGGPRSTHDLAGNELEPYEGTPEDKARPLLLTAVTKDGDANGQIEKLELTFSENIDDNLLNTETSDGWDVDGYASEIIGSGEGENDNLLSLSFDESGSQDTATTPSISYSSSEDEETSTHDEAGNELSSNTWTTTDGAAPISTMTEPLTESIHNTAIPISGSSTDADILGDTDTVNYTRLYFRLGEDKWTEIVDSQRDNELGEEPFAWTFDWTPDEDGVYDIMAEATDTADNTESSPVVDNVTYDTTGPDTPIATPEAGDYTSDQTVELASSDSLSGLASIYYTTDGTEPNIRSGTLYDGTAIAVGVDTTIKAIAYDNAGNPSDVLTAVYGIAPVISAETSSSVTSTSTTITWTTDDPATSRVIYDTVSHGELGAAPNYGYANSTVEADATPKVTSHSVSITGLTAGTTYYYRTVSHGSPDAVSSEKTVATSAASSDGGGGGTSSSGGGGGTGSPGTAPVCSDTKPGSAPTLLSASTGTNSVTLVWSGASDPLTYYLVAFGTSPGSLAYGNPNIGGKGTTSYTVTNLSGGTTYYFRVRAGNGCMPGDYSNELAVTPGGGLTTGLPAGFAPGVLGATIEEEVATPAATPTEPNEKEGKVLGAQPGWNLAWFLSRLFSGMGSLSLASIFMFLGY